MRSFTFKLEKLLEIRKYTEQEKAAVLAEVTGRYMKVVNSIEELKERKKKMMASFFSIKNISVQTIIEDQSIISAIEKKILDLENQLIPINNEREEKRLEYVEALKDQKILEKLKEKKAAEHRKEELSRDSAALDDIVNSSFKQVLED